VKEIILALIGGGFFAFIQFLIARHDEKHSKLNEIETAVNQLRTILMSIEETNKKQSDLINLQAQALTGLGHDKLVRLTNKLIKRGAITIKEKANLKAIYYPYKKLGGNGDGEEGFQVCMKLPVISEQEAYKRDRALKRSIYGICVKEGQNVN
jgi:hypothetical protein